jgi:hypothetical protein
MKDMTDNGKYSFYTYRDRFGNWNDALEEAGIKTNRQLHVPKSDAIKDIKKVSEEYCNGESPTTVDMEEHGKYSEAVYCRKFDWRKILNEAGFRSGYEISREKLKLELKKLAKQLDKTPSSRDMKYEGKYTPSPYRREFGSWNNALKDCGYEPIGYVSGKEHPNWKEDSLSDEESRKLDRWSKRVKRRDEYECQDCESPRSDVRVAHHIKRRKNRPDLMFDEDNGITLCPDCHAERHEGDTVYNSLKTIAEKLSKSSYEEVYHGN